MCFIIYFYNLTLMEEIKESISKISPIKGMDHNKPNEVYSWKEKKSKWFEKMLNKTLRNNFKRLKKGKERLISLLGNTEFPLVYLSNNPNMKFWIQVMNWFNELEIETLLNEPSKIITPASVKKQMNNEGFEFSEDDKLFLQKQYQNLCYIKRRLLDFQAIEKDTSSNDQESNLLVDENINGKMIFANKREWKQIWKETELIVNKKYKKYKAKEQKKLQKHTDLINID